MRSLSIQKVMPFGLSGAPATLQRMMDKLVCGQEEFTGVYLDDIIIFSMIWEAHIQHVKQVLLRFRENRLTSKCQFAMEECSYLGYIVGNGHVQPDQEKIRAVKEFPKPTTKKQVRAFLGLTGYYRKFIASYASLAAPLADLTRNQLPEKVQWSPEFGKAFQSLKKKLCTTPILVKFYQNVYSTNRCI